MSFQKVRIQAKVALTDGHIVEQGNGDGRGLEAVVHPFSFREFLRHRDEEPEPDAARWTAAERSLVEKRFQEYLLAGGFPETQGLPPRCASSCCKAM